MKLKSLALLFLIVPGMMALFQGCNQCDETGTITFSEETQKLSVTYLVDSNGVNYNTIWRPNQVSVAFNNDGGRGQYVSISESIVDGTVDFTYSAGAPDAATKGIFHDYVYILKKDTFGSDTFRIKFYPAVDECKEYWSLIEYYRNGNLIADVKDQEVANVTIRE